MNQNITGLEEIQQRLNSLTPALRMRILRKLGNKITANSKKRITQQTDLRGSAFAPRSAKSQKKKKKMLQGLKKLIKVQFINNARAIIGFSGKRVIKTAQEQQYGKTRVVTAAQNAHASNSTAHDKAKLKQAKQLLKLGYKAHINGKLRKPSLKWIVENLTVGQAGAIIRSMRTTPPKTSWEVVLPARSFLGITDAEMLELLDIVNIEINQAIA